jgi:tyrosyl-tRNA synthetase
MPVMSEGSSELLAPLVRGAEHVIQAGELAERLERGRPLRVKLGVDPTARDVTLGWAVPLRKLRAFQDAGHTAVLIVGDFTARIGDPSGKSETRPQLSEEVVRANAEACLAQLLDVLSEENLEVRYNSEWLGELDLPQVLRLASHTTVARMLERDDFSTRFSQSRPISMVEFLYPLMQGYDSVAVQADVELGGTDQLFNFLLARDLQRAYGQEPQVALTMPLLVGLDGVHKMSQSLGNYVSIRDEPDDMFGKLMSLPDSLLEQYARLATDLPEEEVAEIGRAAADGGPGAAQAKRKIARTVVRMYHAAEAAAGAEAAFDRLFRRHEAPAQMPQADLPEGLVRDGKIYLPALLAELGLAESRSDARRLISQGGVRIDGDRVEAEDCTEAAIRGSVLQVGRRRFVRIA